MSQPEVRGNVKTSPRDGTWAPVNRLGSGSLRMIAAAGGPFETLRLLRINVAHMPSVAGDPPAEAAPTTDPPTSRAVRSRCDWSGPRWLRLRRETISEAGSIAPRCSTRISPGSTPIPSVAYMSTPTRLDADPIDGYSSSERWNLTPAESVEIDALSDLAASLPAGTIRPIGAQ